MNSQQIQETQMEQMVQIKNVLMKQIEELNRSECIIYKKETIIQSLHTELFDCERFIRAHEDFIKKNQIIQANKSPIDIEIEKATENVRQLKAKRVSQQEVIVAVNELKRLKAIKEVNFSFSQNLNQYLNNEDLDIAAISQKIRALKAAKAPVEEVRAAINQLRELQKNKDLSNAADKIQQLKNANASDSDVRNAVNELFN